jgi:hypothetical protein
LRGIRVYEILSPLGAGGMGEVKSECDGYRRLYQGLQTSRGSDASNLPG